MQFRARDIFLPSPDALSFNLIEGEELEGTIMDFSDSGQKDRVFALVDVVTRKTVVVPVEKLKNVGDQG